MERDSFGSSVAQSSKKVVPELSPSILARLSRDSDSESSVRRSTPKILRGLDAHQRQSLADLLTEHLGPFPTKQELKTFVSSLVSNPSFTIALQDFTGGDWDTASATSASMSRAGSFSACSSPLFWCSSNRHSATEGSSNRHSLLEGSHPLPVFESVGELPSAEDDSDDLTISIDDLLCQLQESNKRLRLEKMKLEEEKEELTVTVEQLNTEVEILSQSLRISTKKSESLEGELAFVILQLEQRAGELSQLQMTHTKCQHETQRTLAELSEVKDHNAHLEESLSELQCRIALQNQQEKQIAALKEKNEVLRLSQQHLEMSLKQQQALAEEAQARAGCVAERERQLAEALAMLLPLREDLHSTKSRLAETQHCLELHLGREFDPLVPSAAGSQSNPTSASVPSQPSQKGHNPPSPPIDFTNRLFRIHTGTADVRTFPAMKWLPSRGEPVAACDSTPTAYRLQPACTPPPEATRESAASTDKTQTQPSTAQPFFGGGCGGSASVPGGVASQATACQRQNTSESLGAFQAGQTSENDAPVACSACPQSTSRTTALPSLSFSACQEAGAAGLTALPALSFSSSQEAGTSGMVALPPLREISSSAPSQSSQRSPVPASVNCQQQHAVGYVKGRQGGGRSEAGGGSGDGGRDSSRAGDSSGTGGHARSGPASCVLS